MQWKFFLGGDIFVTGENWLGLRYQIMIDAQLKFAQFPVKNFLNTTLVHEKYILYPT